MTRPDAFQTQDDDIWGELLFTYGDDELDHDPNTYLSLQKPHRERPKRPVWTRLQSLRPELEKITTCSSAQRIERARLKLAQQGFAALTHHSNVLAEHGIDTQQDYTLFVKENQE